LIYVDENGSVSGEIVIFTRPPKTILFSGKRDFALLRRKERTPTPIFLPFKDAGAPQRDMFSMLTLISEGNQFALTVVNGDEEYGPPNLFYFAPAAFH